MAEINVERLSEFRGNDLADLCDAAIIASRTEDHYPDAKALIDIGQRVLLEKLDMMLDRGFTRRGLHHMVRGQP